jgi:hypothetical protein
MMDTTPAAEVGTDPRWQRYGQALVRSMAEVRAETPEEVHPVLMETADYWLSLGLAIGTSQPEAAVRLLGLIEAEEPGRAELGSDAEHFLAEALA